MKKQTLRIGNYFKGKARPGSNRLPGFTIVELLIVIVVIGILAAISIVSYSGIQDRANDTLRRDGANKILKAYKLYMAETGGNPKQLNCGWNDSGMGFIQLHTGGGVYAGETCVEILSNMGYLQENFNDTIPIGTSYISNRRDFTYMIEECSTTHRVVALLWHIKNPSAEDAAKIEAVRQQCHGGSTQLSYSKFGMTGGAIIEW